MGGAWRAGCGKGVRDSVLRLGASLKSIEFSRLGRVPEGRY